MGVCVCVCMSACISGIWGAHACTDSFRLMLLHTVVAAVPLGSVTVLWWNFNEYSVPWWHYLIFWHLDQWILCEVILLLMENASICGVVHRFPTLPLLSTCCQTSPPLVPMLVTPQPPSYITCLAQGPILDDMCQSSSQGFYEALFPYLIKALVCCINILPSHREFKQWKICKRRTPDPLPLIPFSTDPSPNTTPSTRSCPCVLFSWGWMGHARCT